MKRHSSVFEALIETFYKGQHIQTTYFLVYNQSVRMTDVSINISVNSLGSITKVYIRDDWKSSWWGPSYAHKQARLAVNSFENDSECLPGRDERWVQHKWWGGNGEHCGGSRAWIHTESSRTKLNGENVRRKVEPMSDKATWWIRGEHIIARELKKTPKKTNKL